MSLLNLSEPTKNVDESGGVDMICLDFDGCLSVRPLTADGPAELREFLDTGGMGSPRRIRELGEKFERMRRGSQRVCIVSLNKSERIKQLLDIMGGVWAGGANGCSSSPLTLSQNYFSGFP